jgi:hypothetical protein
MAMLSVLRSALMTTTGTLGSPASSRIICSTFSPSKSGRYRSRSTRSGAGALPRRLARHSPADPAGLTR